MHSFKVKGVIVPLITPFDEEGKIIDTALQEHIDFLISRGVHGLFPCGTTGEGPLMTFDERRQVAEKVVSIVNNRIPVIIHAGALTTKETLQLTQHAREIGAQAAAMLPPYFYNLTDKALQTHFETIAKEVADFPVYLYDNPPVSNNSISVDLIARLTERCPNIVGLKDSSGSLDKLAACVSLRNGSFNTINGPDGLLLAGFGMGFDACVSGNANVVPELIVGLYQAVMNGDITLARELQYKVNLTRQVLKDGSDLSVFKGVIAQRGIDVGNVRKPLLEAPEDECAQSWQTLHTLGLETLTYPPHLSKGGE
jgi:4-hydroxy-tetrahydrodipicolinate synthase